MSIQDLGVTTARGVPLVRVQGPPGHMQYQYDDATGTYTFHKKQRHGVIVTQLVGTTIKESVKSKLRRQ